MSIQKLVSDVYLPHLSNQLFQKEFHENLPLNTRHNATIQPQSTKIPDKLTKINTITFFRYNKQTEVSNHGTQAIYWEKQTEPLGTLYTRVK